MSHTDMKFFTNEPERDLYGRFAVTLKSNTQFFDVLVGYFRTSGFFKLYHALETVERMRILVGIDADRFTVKIIDQARDEIRLAAIPLREGYDVLSKAVEKEFEHAAVSSELEKGVRVFVDWLKSGKIEMRMYMEKPIHAKVYIMRKDPEKVPDIFGSVITGSSNFTEAGLINNLEFNVELKDAQDVRFALQRFEQLWETAVDIRDEYMDAIEKRTWLRNDITPYQLYLKTLYEFFNEEINADKEDFGTLLPEGYMRLQYQIDAVAQAWKKLNAYNGVFISDVVGLGKTYICAMLANRFRRDTYKLFICPPVLVDYWRSVLQEFDVARCDVESLGKLDRIISKGIDKYGCVFVDEAHRFRNSDTESFTLLHQICRGKKVVLVSATPINNYTSDIENQIYLFQSKQSGTINGIKNIEGFFRGLNSKLNAKIKGTLDYRTQLRENSEIIRDKLLREIMIRRTRSEVRQYYADDMEKQGLTFPSAGSPERIIYEFDDMTDAYFKETINVIKTFKYSRYTPLLYLKDKKKFAQMMASQRNMGGFMKGVLVKRLESSFHAFRMTLSRFIESYEKFLKMVNSGKIYISKKIDVYDLLDDGDTRKLMYFIEQQDVMEFDTSEFTVGFFNDLSYDLSQLRHLRDIWGFVKQDPKLDRFKHELQNNPVINGKKTIVFTESAETAEYLFNKLKPIFNDRIVSFSGQSSNFLKIMIEDSFNPQRKDKGNNLYDLLITTDVLAEGINLHRANVIINYDLPWNPTKIIQRVGRINRIGTEHDRIFVFNFFPTSQSRQHMPLEERILEKLQSFHDTLGEDSKYLTDEEEVSAKKLFADLSRSIDEDEESTNPELAYLAVIRRIRDSDEALFEQIKRLPVKAKAGRAFSLPLDTATLSFIRKGALKSFFLAQQDDSSHLTFMEAIQYIEAVPDEPKLAVTGAFYDQLRRNSEAFDEMLNEEEAISIEKPMLTGNDAKAIRIVKAILADKRLIDSQENALKTLIMRWENGDIPARVSKDVVKAQKLATDALTLYYDILRLVPETYFEEKREKQTIHNGEKQIILSCFMRNKGEE